ncbi:MAG: hypothetical protein GWN53_17230 [Gammaproteobacteria bacterium]|uniref:Uncharacterized protein n=1 Tax=Candidatus Kutchimonas denitrificans TaxID=3056748 RepID=A0AAE5CD10_9BACT|nr:hypothetical protein [Candidatus Kutchimonas denitrificans]NIV53585.1 hypothetical protein [Gammaproteobacteria bacterium]
MTPEAGKRRDEPEPYCHTCGGYHTDRDRHLCPDQPPEGTYEEGYAHGFEDALKHFVGLYMGASGIKGMRAA